jgi:hypothetical protein
VDSASQLRAACSVAARPVRVARQATVGDRLLAIAAVLALSCLSDTISGGVSILGVREVAGFGLGERFEAEAEAEAEAESLAPPAFESAMSVSQFAELLIRQREFGRVGLAGQRDRADDMAAVLHDVATTIGHRAALTDEVIDDSSRQRSRSDLQRTAPGEQGAEPILQADRRQHRQ